MPNKRAQRARKLMGAAVVSVVIGVVSAVATVNREWERIAGGENWTYDIRVRYTADTGQSESNVVLIDIGESDLAWVEETLHQSWPWPRVLHGYLADYAVAGGARAVMIDLLFMDRGFVVEDLEEFADALRKNARAVIGVVSSEGGTPPARSDGQRFVAEVGREKDRDQAVKIGARLLAWDARVFVTGEHDGEFVIYYGGNPNPEGLSDLTARLATIPALQDLFVGPEGPKEPVAQPMTPAIAGSELTGRALMRDRFGLRPESADEHPVPGARLLPPVSIVTAAVPAIGVVSQAADDDGIFRQYRFFVRDEGLVFPALTTAGYLLANPGDQPVFGEDEVRLGDHRIPVEEHGRAILRFRKGARYSHYSSADVLRSIEQVELKEKPVVPAEVFRDKFVLISAEAAGLRDIKATPLEANHRGAEINALALDDLMEGAFVRRTSRIFDAAIAFVLCVAGAILVVVILNAVASPTIGFTLSTGAGMLLLGGYTLCTFLLLGRASLWAPLFIPVVGSTVSIGAAVLLTSVIERRDRRFVQDALGRYTSKAVVEELMAHPEKLSLEWGEKREMSVYFSDIAGFTTISEGLDPKRLVALLNDYLTTMTDIVLAHGGIIDKYIGDAIMAFWGAPIANPLHARDSVSSALEMMRKGAELKQTWKDQYGHDVYARAGINTGIAVVGNMGSKHKYNYTVMGDMVNLASRLEGANKAYGSTLMISESTYRAVEGAFEVRELDYLAVKGKNVPVRVYEVLGRRGELDAEALAPIEEFTRALELYRARKFELSLAALQRTLELKPNDGPAETYVERCRVLLESPPEEDWDGVWHMKEK